ncbi:MAG: hypothetical protein E7497_05700 [Ruminococcus sp.]|nr:hypothetical protein [Ruminococcus sp.]
MNKLIKAEYYRSLRSGIYFPIFVICGIFALLFPFLMGETDSETDNLYYHLMNYSQGSGILIVAYVGIILSAMIGNMYQNRTYYYEIMNGSNTHHIILSKLVVYGSYAFAVIIIPAIIYHVIIGVDKGTGGMESPCLAAVLGTIIILNIIFFTVFVTMLIRHVIAGAILMYSYSMGVTMVYMFVSDEALCENAKTMEKIFGIFPQVQILNLAQLEYTGGYIATVIGSFIVIFALMYTLTYISYKKKNFR